MSTTAIEMLKQAGLIEDCVCSKIRKLLTDADQELIEAHDCGLSGTLRCHSPSGFFSEALHCTRCDDNGYHLTDAGQVLGELVQKVEEGAATVSGGLSA